MDADNVEWTGRWVAKRLRKHDKVLRIDLQTPQVLRIFRKDHSDFLAGTIASQRVEPAAFRDLLEGEFRLEFIANIPRESFWTGDAIEFVAARSAAFGGMGDLFSAVALPNVSEYEKSEYRFVERGLLQHTKVVSLTRVHDRKYLVRSLNRPELAVVLINEYDLSADHVRTARERYGQFAVVLVTNPNGRPTSSAHEAANSMGAQIFMWGEFLGELAR